VVVRYYVTHDLKEVAQLHSIFIHPSWLDILWWHPQMSSLKLE